MKGDVQGYLLAPIGPVVPSGGFPILVIEAALAQGVAEGPVLGHHGGVLLPHRINMAGAAAGCVRASRKRAE